MNSDTDNLVQEILVKAKAIAKCPNGCGTMLDQEDGDAESVAYGMATNAWKQRDRGFRDMEREDVVALVKRALTHTPSTCPSCNRY